MPEYMIEVQYRLGRQVIRNIAENSPPLRWFRLLICTTAVVDTTLVYVSYVGFLFFHYTGVQQQVLTVRDVCFLLP